MLSSQSKVINSRINDILDKRYSIKNGYSNLISNEKLYERFVKTLGYSYYETYQELTNDYVDITDNLDAVRINICLLNNILLLESKKTKNNTLAIRDIANTNFNIFNNFYFSNIIVLSESVFRDEFRQKHKLHLVEESDQAVQIYLNKIFAQAFQMGASDIHIQKNNDSANIWFRVDGIKINIGVMKVSTAKILKRKLTTLANQEDSDFDSINGIIDYLDGHKKIKLRLGIINSRFNFSITLRIIGGKTIISSELDKLNYPPQVVKALENLTKYDNGMILITGQVGSGKTHLVYALLKKLSRKKKYIVTIENPVEYIDDSFFQIDLSEYESASKDNKYSYPQASVDILRQDTDVILIGETREPETAFQLVNVSNLGQLVFTTMHTNSARGAVARMTNSLGVQASDISDDLRGIVSQKLIRKLCENCKLSDGNIGFIPIGCDQCGGTGFNNRVPVVEIVLFKVGQGGDFEKPTEYISLEDGAMLQYRAGFISKEDVASIIKGQDL